MFGRLGWLEILIIVILVVVLFGHARVPEMMKNVATGLKTFKRELNKSDDVAAKKAPAKKAPAAKKQSVKKSGGAKKSVRAKK